MLFHTAIHCFQCLVLAVFTYRSMRCDLGGRRRLESDEFSPDRGNSYWSGLRSNPITYNLGGNMKNNIGEVVIGVVVTGVVIVAITGLGLYKTAKNGVLENNGKIIWCKMQNKGADFCDNKYLPFPPEGEDS